MVRNGNLKESKCGNVNLCVDTGKQVKRKKKKSTLIGKLLSRTLTVVYHHPLIQP